MAHENMMTASGTDKNWSDVTGLYKIKCAVIEEEYPGDDFRPLDDLSLRIHQYQNKKGSQMYAEFDFGILRGVFRFERQLNDEPATHPQQKTGDKRNREEYDGVDEDEADDSDGYGGRRSPTPESFYLGSIQEPSPTYPTWNYRWRGKEFGETEIDLDADREVYQLTFSGLGGTELTGTVGASALKTCKFTGKKVSMAKKPIDIAEI